MSIAVSVEPDRDTPPLWRSRTGKLLIQRCEACGERFHYPRPFCPFCLSESVSWLECSGRGEIYTYSIVRRGTPYAIAIVTLEEGPSMMTSIVGCPLDDIRIGQSVLVSFRDVGGVATPMFQLV